MEFQKRRRIPAAVIRWPPFHPSVALRQKTVQALARQLTSGKQNRTFVNVLPPVVQIPVELETLFIVIEHPLPGREQLEEIARGVATFVPEATALITISRLLANHLASVIPRALSLPRNQASNHPVRLATGPDGLFMYLGPQSPSFFSAKLSLDRFTVPIRCAVC